MKSLLATLLLGSTLLITTLTPSMTWANETAKSPYFCTQKLEDLPILQNGRVKPLYVHAGETIKYLSGKSLVDGHSAVVAYCLLSMESLGLPKTISMQVPIEHVQTKEYLGLTSGAGSMPYSEALPLTSDLRAQMRLAPPESSYQKDLQKLVSRLSLYQNIIQGANWVVAEEGTASDVHWTPVASYLTEERVMKRGNTSATPFKDTLKATKENYLKTHGDSYLLELTYAKMRFPVIGLILALLALGALRAFKNPKYALAVTALLVANQLSYITLRIIISGRAPVTNMYETVLFSGFGALILALIIGHLRQEKMYLYAGLFYSLCTLMMQNFAGGMLSSSIGPLVPVLRDNFWLSTHVTTIIVSYGALALSWVLANTVMIKRRFYAMEGADERYYSDVIYTCLKWGTVMLGAGIILGGVWADYSWGRFWGWDPKETWSLIAFCLYMAILHGRYTNWIPTRRFVPLTAAAFMSVMMAWFGVNYILATGLHSYGFSEGGAIFLGSFMLAQTVLIIVCELSNFSAGKNKEAHS